MRKFSNIKTEKSFHFIFKIMETSMTSFLLNEEENSLHLKDSSVSVTVPNYPIARLMYYIDCIDSLIDLEIPSKLTDYSNYGRLTTKEENQILVYASLLHPNIFIERGILFENDKYCGDSNNKFYEITAIKKHRVISNNFYIKGKLVRVLNIIMMTMMIVVVVVAVHVAIFYLKSHGYLSLVPC